MTYNAGPFHGRGTVWNLSCSGWRLTEDVPMRPGETLSLSVKLPNEQRIMIPEAVVQWSRGSEFAVENMKVEPHIQVRLERYLKQMIGSADGFIPTVLETKEA